MISYSLLREFDKNRIEYKTDLPLKARSTFRIGGTCRLAIFPHSEQALADSIRLLDGASVDFSVVGKGSNTLFSDGIIERCLVFTDKVRGAEFDDTGIRCSAGDTLPSLAAAAADRGLSGLEFACGIPGSVGGAVYMNAGAHGGSMGDIVDVSFAYDRKTASLVEIKDHAFGYRRSIYMQDPNFVCLGAHMVLERAGSDTVRAKMSEFLDARRRTQPLQQASAGSYFKRPENNFAGKLIDECGLKGVHIGDARVSEKHAGFIVNVGNATFAQVMALEELVINTVRTETGITLEREVCIID